MDGNWEDSEVRRASVAMMAAGRLGDLSNHDLPPLVCSLFQCC